MATTNGTLHAHLHMPQMYAWEDSNDPFGVAVVSSGGSTQFSPNEIVARSIS